MKRRTIALFALGLLVFVTSCAPSPAATVSAGREPIFDEPDQVIIFPIQEFTMSERQARMVKSANETLIDECLEGLGLSNPMADIDWTELTPTQTRLFGPWNLDWVASHGYDYPPDPALEDVSKEMQALSETWEVEFVSCRDSVELFNPVTVFEGDNIAIQGWYESYAAAEARPDWIETVQSWRDCLSGKGIETGPDSWIPILPEGEEAQIRVAIADVECKGESELVTRLSTLLAEEQTKFIANHESALHALAAERDSTLEAAREYLGVEESKGN